MKGSLMIGLLVAVALLGAYAVSQTAALKEHQKQLTDARAKAQELEAKLVAKSASDALDLQGRCAKQAAEAFKLLGLDKSKNAGYMNHYNQELGKCFIKTMDMSEFGNAIWNYKMLVDAFELKDYAEYTWHTEENKMYSEVRPVSCRVTLPSGQEKLCASDDEFESLVKDYMER